MSIPLPPVAPVPASATFAPDALAFTQWMQAFGTALPDEVERINAIGYGSYSASSSTSLVVGTGAKSLVVEAGKGFVPGQMLVVARTSAPTTVMTGTVTSYNTATGALVLDVVVAQGSGTYVDWSVSVTAVPLSSTAAGTVVMSASAPSDGTWLECDGSVYLQASYPDLSAQLGCIPNNLQAVLSWKNNAGVTAAQNAVCWSGSEFVSCGGTSVLRLGADGLGNTAATHGGSNLSAIASNGSGLVVATPSTGAGTIRSTDGGATWAAGGAIADGAGRFIAYGNGQFVAVGNLLCATSPDGVAWTPRVFAENPSDLVHAGGANWIAAVISTGNVVRSTDNAATWGSPIATGLNSVAGLGYEGGKLVAVGDANGMPAIAVSRDGGATWALAYNRAAGGASYLQAVAASNGLWVAHTGTSAQGLLWSTDAWNWQHQASTAAIGGGGAAIAAGNGRFVSVNGAASNGAQTTFAKHLTYDPSTQFAVPPPDGQLGVKKYIKAQTQPLALTIAQTQALVTQVQAVAAQVGQAASVVATGTVVLTAGSATYQFIDPNGANRDITLPAPGASDRVVFGIKNTGAAFSLTAKNASGVVVGVAVPPSYSLTVVWDGAQWEAM